MQKLPIMIKRRAVPLALLALAAVLGIYTFFASPGPTGNGRADVGGPFTMVNHLGQTVTEKDFHGKYMLVFFGFTYCPDICPTTLQVIGSALSTLGAKGENITPVLVSVDTARDTPEILKNYIENFGPRFVALTGSPEQLQAMAKTFKVYYKKIDNEKRPQDYLMDHSSIMYLMGPDGLFVKHFTYTTDPQKLADQLAEALK